MADPIIKVVDDANVLAVLDRLVGVEAETDGLLRSIGERLAESTKRRFETSTAPDGSRWATNTETTFLAYLGRFSGSYRKDGRLSSKGAGRAMGKKPLIGESGALSTQIYYQVAGGTLEVGSPMEYAAMQQFGGTKAQWPHLWGDIPARPFLGISAEDVAGIDEDVSDFLDSLLDA